MLINWHQYRAKAGRNFSFLFLIFLSQERDDKREATHDTHDTRDTQDWEDGGAEGFRG
jgi:hypothetical protein